MGSPHWWDSAFSGSVASTLPLRERLLFSNAEEALIWVGGDANMNGVAAGSWSGGFYAIVWTADFDVLLKAILTDDFGAEDCTEEELIVAIWEFLCILMIVTYCAARWTTGQIYLFYLRTATFQKMPRKVKNHVKVHTSSFFAEVHVSKSAA